MVTLLEGIREGVRITQCALLSFDEFVLGGVGRFSPGLRDIGLEAVNANRRLLGCPETGDVEPPPSDFEGGQCLNIAYNIDYVFIGSNNQQQSGSSQGVLGPINGITAGPVNEFGGVPLFINAGAIPENRVQIGTTTPPNAGSGAIVSVTRSDLLPDECGSPPPTYPPPTTINIDTDITYNTDDGTEVNLTVPFVYAPITANFDGSLRIPFTLDIGGFEFSGDVNLGRDLNVTINPPALPPGSGDDTDTLPPGDPGDDVPPLPPDQKIIGVAVSSSIVGEQQLTTILTQGMPNILAPRAGSIKFAYSLSTATFWSSDIDVKGDRTFIPCPFSQGADAVVVSPAPGVAVNWVPIRGFPLATTRDVQTGTPAP